MARSIARRKADAVGTFRTSQNIPGLRVDPVPYFSPPRGLNNLAPLSRVPNEFTPHIRNLVLDEGVLRSRLGTIQMGSEVALGADTMAVLMFTAQDGISAIIRVTTQHLWTWGGLGWNQVFGLSFNGGLEDRFTWTGWGNELLITNGIDKIRSYNIMSGEPKILEESPPARHITSFNGRVIASAVVDGSFLPYRTQWCVKLNHEDWTAETTTDAIGAGEEDLLAVPASYVDEVMGVFPVTDDTALMVRENSLWLMFNTGDVVAPFRFSRMIGAKGSRARHSIQSTPFGIVLLTNEDVVVANPNGFESIGESIRKQLHSEITSYAAVSSLYDPIRQEYRLATGSSVWRFSFVDKGWTRDAYPFDLRHLSVVDYQKLGLTFDELTGTFDELEGRFDDLYRDEADRSIHFVATDNRVLREDEVATGDDGTDGELEIRTGLLQGGSYFDRTELIEAQLEYECELEQTLFFEYSNDKGSNWNNYSEAVVTPTSGPTILAVRRTLTHHNLQVRVRTSVLGKLTLISLNLFVVKGVRVNP